MLKVRIEVYSLPWYSSAHCSCCSEDQFWGRSARLQAEAVFAARKDTDNFVEYEFKDYKGVCLPLFVEIEQS